MKYEELDIQWYHPGEAEISIVEQIFWKYLILEKDKVDKYNKNEADLTR